MIEPRDGKHAQDIERYRNGYGGAAPTNPDHAETGYMDKDERQGTQAVNLTGGVTRCQLLRCRFGIEPTHQGNQPSFQ